ncbi:DUF512 domain-containing protein [Desulfotruncus alcoholivorax]|uniref:DUF512 domain-containing protein n=1 Tax=Desulfotruncus alcoholivorax TaxID=265477 RepID=UPI0004290719|nr:DUF512 domain-containing protein [Desulfotruncus alcoholivorax]
MRDHGLVVQDVEPDSIAGELGVEPGDSLLQVNGKAVLDILDYRYLTAEENLEVLLQKENGEQWLLDIEKDLDEPLGITFVEGGWGKTRSCGNNCIFCFVDQMPSQMRPSLYVKDDDYRLSFAQGNFITLTNTGPQELERIARLRLSPLYISVHTTNPELRREMMMHPRAGEIMSQLTYLADKGIKMHTQAVLCPGINDGEQLDRTIKDLGGLWPAVRSLAVVPVGLTAWREGLYELRPYSRDEARTVIDQVRGWQEAFNSQIEYPFVFASDEFYLISGRLIPDAGQYGGFPQTENGVGLVRLFMDEWEAAARNLPVQVKMPLRGSVATGTLAGPVLQPVIEAINGVKGVQLKLYILENQFFGKTVNVAGLLTGRDLQSSLSGRDLGEVLFVPKVMLRRDDDVFLDDMTVADLAAGLGVAVVAVTGPADLVQYIKTVERWWKNG